MKSERIKPNCVTLCSLVRAYGRAGDKEMIKAVIKLIENSDVLLDTAFFNCLVDAYARVGCLGEMQGVLDMMEKKKCKPDKVTINTMVRDFVSKGINDQSVQDLRNVLKRLIGFFFFGSRVEIGFFINGFCFP